MKFTQCVALMLLALCSGSAFAEGSCLNCLIKNFGVGPYFDSICTSGSCVFVSMDGTVSNRPGCSTNSTWHFVLDVTTPGGRTTYAMLLAAKSAGTRINISGANNCVLSPAASTENLYWVTYP